MSGCVHQVAVHEHCSKTVWDRFVLAYTPGVLRVFCSDGFPYVIAPAFSTPAFSTPTIYSCIFHSRIFSAPPQWVSPMINKLQQLLLSTTRVSLGSTVSRSQGDKFSCKGSWMSLQKLIFFFDDLRCPPGWRLVLCVQWCTELSVWSVAAASYLIVVCRCLSVRSNDIRRVANVDRSSSPPLSLTVTAAAAAAAAVLTGISRRHAPQRRLRIKATTGCSVHIHLDEQTQSRDAVRSLGRLTDHLLQPAGPLSVWN